VDPVIVLSKDWRNDYQSNDDGLVGWTRVRGDLRQDFTSSAEGDVDRVRVR
jgi:hypothetical protein